MVGIVRTYTTIGIDGQQLTVECDATSQVFGVTIVGMASSAVKESQDRIFAALRNSGWDAAVRRFTINLAPADIRKTMLARRVPTILPELSLDEALEATKIHSVAGHSKDFHNGILTTRPYRSPHHTVSDVAVIIRGK